MYTEKKFETAALFIFRRLIMVMVLFRVDVINPVLGQTKVGCNQITVDMGFTVRSVIIKGRWVPKELQQKVEEIVGVGKPFDPATLSRAMELVRNELIKEEERFGIQLVGSTSVLFITPNVCDVSDDSHPRQTEIVIYPFYLRIDLYNVGLNLLPLPRTAKPTFYTKVPAVLLAATPRFGMTTDRKYGTALDMQTTTDLLHLPHSVAANTDTKGLNLYLDLRFRKSVSELFHTLGASVKLDHPVYAYKGSGWNIGVEYARTLQPLGLSDYKLKLLRFFAGVNGNLQIPLLKKYSLGGALSFLQNSFDTVLDKKSQNGETDYEVHFIGDDLSAHGFKRLGIWFAAGVPEKIAGLKSYQRLAGRFGYAATLGKMHNNVDMEVNFGVGYTWGSAPSYSQFYAGNTLSNFLYVPLKSRLIQSFPTGPIIRSLGEQEGAFQAATGRVAGGRSYWNLNLSFSIPVSKWAVPLIPDMVIDDETGSTARRKIKGLVNFAQSFIQLDLVDNGGLSEEQADAEAEKIVNKDIRPAINYLADRANVYSIKPIILFDLAQLDKRGIGKKTWGAAGGGVQLNIVNARLDIAYMQTVFPASDKSKGNFLVRFAVQNFY